MTEPFVIYRRACDRSVNLLGFEWVADLPGPGGTKLVSDSKQTLEAGLARLLIKIEGGKRCQE